MPFSMQLVCPGVQIAAWQLLAWQYCPVGQSVEVVQRTHEPLVRSQSRPRGVQVRSEAHFVRHMSATQVLVASAQSASARQSTQRPAVASQTWALAQSSEFLHGVNGTQVRAVQSLFAGQSAAVTHITHWAIEGSQNLPERTLQAVLTAPLRPGVGLRLATAATPEWRHGRHQQQEKPSSNDKSKHSTQRDPS